MERRVVIEGSNKIIGRSVVGLGKVGIVVCLR